MSSTDHFGFILAAYIAAVVVVGTMIVMTVTDYASLKKRLAQLTRRAGADADRI